MEDDEIDAKMSQPLPDLQSFHAALHQRILDDFAGIADEELDLPSKFWAVETYSLRFRLHRFDAHLRQHTVQIEKTANALGLEASESRRLLRLIYEARSQVEGALIGLKDDDLDLLGESALRLDQRTIEIEALLADAENMETG